MNGWLGVVLLVGLASADISSVVDDILRRTSAHFGSAVNAPDLKYYERTWNKYSENYDLNAELLADSGHIVYGDVQRERAPVLWGTANDGILETKFTVDVILVYPKYKAIDFRTGSRSDGVLAIKSEKVEMFSWVKMKNYGGVCDVSLTCLYPIHISPPTAVFQPDAPGQTEKLFSKARYQVVYNLNNTEVVSPLVKWFKQEVTSLNLCELLA